MAIHNLKLSILYFLTTINALAPYRLYLKSPIHAETCALRTIYCYTISSIIFVIVLFNSYTQIITIIVARDDKFVGFIIFLIQILVTASATSILCFFQVIHRHDFVRRINKCVELNKLIKSKTLNQHAFLDQFCIRVSNIRMCVSLFQVAILMLPMVGESIDGQDAYRLLTFFFVSYTHCIRTIYDFMFFGGMLIVLQFYRDVNCRIKSIMSDTEHLQTSDFGFHRRMQVYCDLSDELDIMAQLYEQVTDFVLDLMKFFEGLVLVEIITAFVNILFGV